MNRYPLQEADKAFLSRLEPANRRSTFASYIFDEIRGHKWRPEQYRGLPATNPAYILQEVMERLRFQVQERLTKAWHADADVKAQWYEALVLYPDEALRYIRWCLAWEQRSKREKRQYQWNQYQQFQRATRHHRADYGDSYDDLTPILDAFARQHYGMFGPLEQPWPVLLEAYMGT